MTKMQRPIGNAWAYLDRNRPRRAVFYGRVSTEHEAQLSALENQMQWYEDQAKYHPNWTIVGKYIDEGITARMEQVKAKKERLLDMRTDGEITKEEFLTQRQKLDAELQNLTAEYEKLTRMRRKRTSTSPSGAGFRKPWNKFWIYPSRNPVPT